MQEQTLPSRFTFVLVWLIGQFRGDGRTVRHLFLMCIKYEITITGSYLCLWVIHKNITLVSTYTRIILCFSYLLTQNRDYKGLWRTYAEKWIKWYYTALQLIPSDWGPCSIRSSHYGWAEDTWEYWKQHDFEQLLVFVEIHHIHCDGRTEFAWRTYASQLFLHITILKLTKLKESTLFQLCFILCQRQAEKGNNSSSFMMFMHLN